MDGSERGGREAVEGCLEALAMQVRVQHSQVEGLELALKGEWEGATGGGRAGRIVRLDQSPLNRGCDVREAGMGVPSYPHSSFLPQSVGP